MGLSEGSEYSDVLSDSYVTGSVTASTTQIEAKVGGSPLSRRELLYIENKGSQAVYYGPTGVTSSSGAVLEKNNFIFLPVGESISVFLITASGSSSVIIQEFA